MEWFVYKENPNARTIEKWNVFRHSAFEKEVCALLDEITMTKEKFAEKLESAARYCFWCRCEYEVVISEWPPVNRERFPDRKEVAIKVDIFSQLQMNWEAFVNYCWEHKWMEERE